MRKELPILLAITALAAWQLLDGEITRTDAVDTTYLIGSVFVS
ncbi:MAG: hypothetical protein Q8J65_07860 [Nitrosomonadales bacterium]|nr:hypothetical protein [Nitrosomonadales bacterium]